MPYMIAADTGGTFTDVVVYDTDRGNVVYTKSLSTYEDLAQGVMDCLAKVSIDLNDAETIKFGTTLVINTFTQRNGVKCALVCTAGFRDILEIARGNRPVPFDLRFEREKPLVDRAFRLPVEERVAADGEILKALDDGKIDDLVERLRILDVEAIAISLLNAYANDAHERVLARELRARLPHVYVCTGTELSKEWFEYERTSTAVANAYVGPVLDAYVERLDQRLAAAGSKNPFLLMSSNGGVFSIARARRQPVMLVESGPVGGCIGAGVYAKALGLGKVIAFDMGGTTAKCALLENGSFEVKSPYYVGGYERGFPVSGGVLDIVEVGAGGGSIAWRDAYGGLHVGPRSAGSTPGPVCYGRGGTEPTITDANLVLGAIASSSFLGGELRLDEAAARAAMEEMAGRLGLAGEEGIDETAYGILSLGVTTMASAIKQVSVERGVDTREVSMIAFGGGGPLHSARLARELNIPHVVIPPEPGNFSALGMLLADARVDEAQTFIGLLDLPNLHEAEERFHAMEVEAARKIRDELGVRQVLFERQFGLSFVGQKHSVRIPVGKDAGVEGVRLGFETLYERRYGHVERNMPIQFDALVLTAVAPMKHPALADLSPSRGQGLPAARPERPVYFARLRRRVDTPVFQRTDLPVGFAGIGPAVIEEYGSTTIVGPDDRFEVGRLGEIHLYFEGTAE